MSYMFSLPPPPIPPPEVTHEVLRSKCPDVDWNAVDSDGNTLPMVAMLRRHLNKAELLLVKGQTDVTRRNKEGKTVLMIAVENHNRITNELYASKIFEIWPEQQELYNWIIFLFTLAISSHVI